MQTWRFSCVLQASHAGTDLQIFSLAPEWRTLALKDMAEENQREYLLEIEASGVMVESV